MLITRDQNHLAIRDWKPASGVATDGQRRPLVLIVHGLGEHSGRYTQLATRLAAAGYPVRAYDQYGHGGSSGPRGGLARELQLVEHLGEVAAAARQSQAINTASAPPAHAGLVLLGHSLGGLVAASAVARGVVQPSLLVLSSPALAVKMAAWQRAAVKWLPRIAPNLTLGNGLDPQILSHDPKVVADYIADPLVHDRICARLGAFVAFEGERVRAAANRWSTPTLLLYAGDDRAVDPLGSREFAARAPRGVLTSHCFEPLYHEIFNEPEDQLDASPVTLLEKALADVA